MSALPEEVRALVAAPNIAHVATLMSDGAPHGVPVWIGIEDGRAAFLTSPSSRKARNLARDPRISVSIAGAERWTAMAQIRGRVQTPVEGKRAWEIIDRISHDYIGAPYPLREDRIVFLVNAELAWAHDFG